MPSLKSLLESLFKLSGGQALAGGLQSAETITGSAEYVKRISPCNGYCNFQSNEKSARLSVGSSSNALWVTALDTNIGTCGAFIPCKKGQEITLWLTEGKQATLRWLKTVGSS